MTFTWSSCRWSIILRYLPRRHERVAAAIASGDLEVTGLLMRRYIRKNNAVLATQLP